MRNKVIFIFLFCVSFLALPQVQIGKIKQMKVTNQEQLAFIHGKSFQRVGFLGISQTDLNNVLQNQDSLSLSLFSDLKIVAIKNNNVHKANNGFYWKGDLKNMDGYVDLYVNNNTLVGTVYTSQKVYKLDALNSGTIRVVELAPEEDTHFECEVLEGHQHDEIELPTLESVPTSSSSYLPPATLAAPVIIDVMVIYPKSIEDLMGGVSAMENEINYRIEEANQVFVNSLINIEFRLAHHQVETSVPSNAQSASDVRTSAVEVLRAQYKADLVSFWSDNGSAGSGYNFEGTGSLSSGYNTSRFSLVQSYYTFIHEMGHNMGAKHDRQAYYESSPTSSKLNVSPYYRYGKSFVGYRSIMSYSNCADLPGGSSSDCERVPYLTNPDVMVNGKPFGVEGEQQTYSVNGPANNARRINETAPYVANYYIGSTPPTVTITSPANQSTIEFTTLNAVVLEATANDTDGQISELYFEIDGEKIVATLNAGKYTATWTPKTFKQYTIKALAVDDVGTTGTDQIIVNIDEKLVDNNLKLVSILGGEIGCITSLDLSIEVENRGNNVISLFDIETYINDQLINSTSHTTQLTTGQKETISLAPIEVLNSGQKNIKVKVLLAQEESPIDNEITNTYDLTLGNAYQFYIVTRSVHPNIAWTVKNSNNEIIADQHVESSENENLTVQNFCLANGCFDIDITSPFQDGTCTTDMWVTGTQYCEGDEVQYNGIIYQADWCNTNEPGASQWGGWKEVGTCAVTYDDDFLGVKNLKTNTNEFEINVKDFNNSIAKKICTDVITTLDPTLATNVFVSPNPFTNEISIHGISQGTVTITNQLNQIVWAQNNTNTINTEALPQGFYILTINGKEMSTQFKLVKN